MRVLYLFSPSPVRKSGIKYPEIRYLLECFLAAGPSMTYLWLAAVGAIAMLTGPLVGGLINNRTTWRWVFLISPPVAAVALIVILLTIPRNFPHR